MDYKILDAIWKKKNALEIERRDKERELMDEYNKTHYEKIRALQDECGRDTGHNWMFSNHGPLGHAWFHCTGCGKSKVEGDKP